VVRDTNFELFLKTKSEARNPKSETKMLNPKLETLNSKRTKMPKAQKSKLHDLENIRVNC
jgi:hypothetical protein